MPDAPERLIHLSHHHGQQPRILFYSHDSYGLGHIRRTLALAAEIGRAAPQAALLVLTGSLQAHAFDLPSNFDYVKLPTISKDAHGAYVSRSLPIPLDLCLSLRERVIREATQAFQPDILLVDHAPAGLRGELVPTLRYLREHAPETRLILGLRDIVDEPSAVRSQWLKDGVYDLLDQLYDRILIYGSQRVFDPIGEYGLSPSAASKTTFCGYIAKPAPDVSPAQIRARLGIGERALVVVTVGGGGDGGPLIDAYLQGLAAHPLNAETCIVTGPFLHPHDRAAIAQAAEAMPHLHVVTFTDHLTSYLNAADAVVTMGGYNTLCEAVGLNKRVVVVPRVQPRQEQALRAQRFAELGLVRMVDPADLSPEVLIRTTAEALADPVPPSGLDFDGLQRASAAVTSLLAASARDDAAFPPYARNVCGKIGD